VKFLYLEGDSIPADILPALRETEAAEAKLQAWLRLRQYSPRLIFHETFHYWQGLRFPFFQWYAFLAFRGLAQAFDKLNQSNRPLHEWSCYAPSLHLPTKRIRCRRTKAAFILGDQTPGPGDVVDDVSLSAIDVLEAATSVAEWQVTQPSSGATDELMFMRWRKRNPAYTQAFDFLAGALGDRRLALRSILALVATSFSTTNPARAFFLLTLELVEFFMAPIGSRFAAQQEPCRWAELFDELIRHVEFEALGDSTANLDAPPFCRLTLDAWMGAGFGNSKMGHPVIAAPAKEWSRRAEEDPGYRNVLTLPAWIPAHVARECGSDFAPPVTVVRIRISDNDNHVFLVGDASRSDEFRDLLTFYSVVRRATGAYFDPDHRLCHHAKCPEFAYNYCNSYPRVPERYQDCGFPRRVSILRETLKRRHIV
jgi:hypothetical protein